MAPGGAGGGSVAAVQGPARPLGTRTGRADGTVAEVFAGPLDEQLLVERLRSVLGVR